MAQKPLTAGEKNVLFRLALYFEAVGIEENVLKPLLEKEGKPFSKGAYVDTYLAMSPEVAQVVRAFDKARSAAVADMARAFAESRRKWP